MKEKINNVINKYILVRERKIYIPKKQESMFLQAIMYIRKAKKEIARLKI